MEIINIPHPVNIYIGLRSRVVVSNRGQFPDPWPILHRGPILTEPTHNVGRFHGGLKIKYLSVPSVYMGLDKQIVDVK